MPSFIAVISFQLGWFRCLGFAVRQGAGCCEHSALALEDMLTYGNLLNGSQRMGEAVVFKLRVHMDVKFLEDGRRMAWTTPFSLLVYGQTHSDLEREIRRGIGSICQVMDREPDGIERMRSYLEAHGVAYSEEIETSLGDRAGRFLVDALPVTA